VRGPDMIGPHQSQNQLFHITRVYIILFTSTEEVWLSLRRFQRNSQMLCTWCAVPLTQNFTKLGQKTWKTRAVGLSLCSFSQNSLTQNISVDISSTKCYPKGTESVENKSNSKIGVALHLIFTKYIITRRNYAETYTEFHPHHSTNMVGTIKQLK